MSDLKTTASEASVTAFAESVENQRQCADSAGIIDMMRANMDPPLEQTG